MVIVIHLETVCGTLTSNIELTVYCNIELFALMSYESCSVSDEWHKLA